MKWKPANFEMCVVQQVSFVVPYRVLPQYTSVRYILFVNNKIITQQHYLIHNTTTPKYQLLDTQFEQYINTVKTTDCQATLRRLLKNGPPIYISDKHGLPLEEGDTHVTTLWFAVDNRERSGKLKGAVDGEERVKLWKELNEFLIEEGKEEGDDDDEEGADGGDE
jgi:hypothetical protein